MEPTPVKKPWESKTIWINLIMAVAAFMPPVHAVLVAHAEYFTYGMIAINLLLRLVTQGKIQIAD
jgi:hypothetical protein